MAQNQTYSKPIDEILKELETSKEGLSQNEATERFEQYGPNELQETEKITPLEMFIGQFKNPMVIILLIAIVISVLTVYFDEVHGAEGFIDAVVIAIIVVLNAVFGFVQEYRSEQALESLKKMAAPHAKVKRNGKWEDIEARELVPGDIVSLEQGNIVPADGRVMNAIGLSADESALTGESVPVQKTSDVITMDSPSLGDMRNLTFQGSVISMGKGTMVVTATGMSTEFGKIAEMVQESEEEQTPLQRDLELLGKQLGIIILSLSALVFFALVFLRSDYPWTEALFIAIALAVAAIPEGMPAIVTVTLAIGVKSMVKRNAIVRKLPSVESLGATTVICSDKTGTITKNQMTVRYLSLRGLHLTISGSGYEKKGEYHIAPRPESCISLTETLEDFNPIENQDLVRMLEIGQMCSNAVLQDGEQEDSWEVLGDPTEGALLVAAEKAGVCFDDTRAKYEDITEISFDSSRKRMTTIHRDKEGEFWAFTKGAPEIVLERSSYILADGEEIKLEDDLRERILEKNLALADCAMRVLGLAYRRIPEEIKDWDPDEIEHDLVFVGLAGMIDPPRDEIKEAVKKARGAGIRPIMITGDHERTATAIARIINLVEPGTEAVSGAEIEAMDDDELFEIVKTKNVYARVAPEHKLRIVKALKKQAHIVAMTGDGVNDAPAIRTADVGIAMGIQGADVTKEAADLILTDDNFATIVSAVEYGREIYSNIRKFVRFLLSANAGEVLLVFLMVMIGLPVPLTPIEILWINLVTDGPPALALGVDPAEKCLMDRPPRGSKKKLLDRGMSLIIIIGGILATVATSIVYIGFIWMQFGGIPADLAAPANAAELAYARTGAFVTMIVFQLLWVWNCRDERRPVWRSNIREAKYLFIAVLASFALTLLVLYSPLAIVFGTVPLGVMEWLIIIGATLPGLLLPVYHVFDRAEEPNDIPEV
ncbi:MAG: HAD-IC family P-type ATPase [Candidatus Lokiarchaeota archaeon]|nr:HAD-IC family P-type ATPase [Candidatus Lokiarchaeota archaeon]